MADLKHIAESQHCLAEVLDDVVQPYTFWEGEWEGETEKMVATRGQSRQ